MLKDKIKVSVVMIAYNHEKYIKEAIEGVLMQEGKHEIELIIADDKSQDNTENIVLEIIENHKNGSWIKYIKHKQNKGMMPNFIWAMQQAKGDYIALCEGDDFWIDPRKLKKQIDFLEVNSDFTFSMGRVDTLNDSTKEIKKRKEYVNPDNVSFFKLKDYLKDSFSQTSSFVFRNDSNPLPSWFSEVHAGDQSIVVIKTGVNGKIKYHSDHFSVYRINEGSVTFTSTYNPYCKTIETLKLWNKYTDYKYNYILKFRQIKMYLSCKSYGNQNNLFLKIIEFSFNKFYNFCIKVK